MKCVETKSLDCLSLWFQEPWLVFDVIVVAISFVGVAVDLATTQDLTFLPVLRVLRVLRIFRLVGKHQGLR